MRRIQNYFGISVLMFLSVSIVYSFSDAKAAPNCANSISCEDSLYLKVENNQAGIFNNQPVIPPSITLSENESNPSVLGESSSIEEKYIEVDLAKQKAYAFEGDKVVLEATISSGKWGRTPTGEFTVWTKIRATRMTGGSGADYYNLPNVPYVMFYSNRDVPASAGFSLHGAYWHNNFGHPMSHGCINMKPTDAKKFFEWADNKIKVTIYGEAPV